MDQPFYKPMSLFILLIANRIVINCVLVGCMQTSLASFNTILLTGTLELIFEIPYVVKIYKKIKKGKVV